MAIAAIIVIVIIVVVVVVIISPGEAREFLEETQVKECVGHVPAVPRPGPGTVPAPGMQQ